MTLKEVAQWLLDNSYAHIVNNNNYVIDRKFYTELGFVNNTSVQPEAIIPPSSSDPKSVWNKFIEDAAIPWRVKTADGLSYTIRQYSVSIAKRLVAIINDPKVDYKKLVESTKHYYATTSYKLLLSNYIDKGVWKDAYDNYKPTTIMIDSSDGSNRWES